nr:hypothetical protein CFP56_52227 [Quercus suber]
MGRRMSAVVGPVWPQCGAYIDARDFLEQDRTRQLHLRGSLRWHAGLLIWPASFPGIAFELSQDPMPLTEIDCRCKSHLTHRCNGASPDLGTQGGEGYESLQLSSIAFFIIKAVLEAAVEWNRDWSIAQKGNKV